MGVWLDIGMYLWETFKIWLHTIFVAPIEVKDMLWVLAPIYLSWIFTEIYQEKTGTSLGNAISNGVVALWAGFDWARNTAREFLKFDPLTIGKIILAILIFIYGILIIVLGIKAKRVTKYIGRIREVTYIAIIFTPLFYNAVELTPKYIVSIFLFFPIFYFFVEFIDWITPNPKAVEEDIKEIEKSKKEGFPELKIDVPFLEADLGFGQQKQTPGFNQQTPFMQQPQQPFQRQMPRF